MVQCKKATIRLYRSVVLYQRSIIDKSEFQCDFASSPSVLAAKVEDDSLQMLCTHRLYCVCYIKRIAYNKALLRMHTANFNANALMPTSMPML